MHPPPIRGQSVCFSLHQSWLASSPSPRSSLPSYKYYFQVCAIIRIQFHFSLLLSFHFQICSSSMAMSTIEEVPKLAQAKPAKAKLAKEKKPRASKVTKEKKAKVSKPSSPSHPPYFQMIKEALLALNEKTGSSPHAIAKFMEEKHKGVLPAKYKKMLAIQLKSFTAKGKLVKVKASFKLSDIEKKEGKPVKKEKKQDKAQKPKEVSSDATKLKAPFTVAATKRKELAASFKAPKKAMEVKKGKKATSTKPKQPKSIKSPATKKAKKNVT